jgi:hypothetical protein
MIKKFSGASLKQCILLPQFGTVCYFWAYVITYEYFLSKADLFIFSTQMSVIILFLSNGDSKYSYVFPLITNVVLRLSHKECY